MYISMTNMLVSSESLHNYIFDVFNHMINPVGYSVTLLVFSIPVFIIGFRFYIPGLKTLFKLHPNMDSLISIGSITAFIYSFVYTIIILVDPINNAHYGMNLLYEASVTVISLISFAVVPFKLVHNTIFPFCFKSFTILGQDSSILPSTFFSLFNFTLSYI